MAGGTPLGNMVIQLGLDSTKMEDALTRSKNQLKNFEKQIKAQAGLASFYKNGKEAAAAYTRQQEVLNKAIQTQSQLLKRRKADYDVEVAANGNMSKRAQQLAGEIELGNAKLAQYASQLREVAKAGYLASSKLQGAGVWFGDISQKAGKYSQSLDTVSRNTRAMSLAIFGGMGLAARSAIEFESAFTGVTKTVDEVVDKNGKVTYSYQMLSDGIRQMAKEIPASTTEISKVAEAAGQLGIETPHILEFTKTMIALGESTNLSSEEAATALAKFQNITQMSQKDFSRLGSVIVDLGNNMATTEKDITEMGLRLASTGKLVGLTEPQILALAASLSATGMEAEAGGSAMSRFMQKVNTAVASGGEDLAGFAQVAGKSAKEFAQTWQSAPQDAIVSFAKGLKRIKDSGGDVTQTLKDLGINSVREIDSLQRLAGAGDLLEGAFKRSTTAWEQNIALSKEAGKRYATTESKLKIFKNKINDIAIELGGPLVDAMTDVLEAGEPIIRNIADMAKQFTQLDKETQRNIIKMALLAGSISPVAKAASSLLGGVKGLTGGMSTLFKWMANVGAEKAAAKALAGVGIEAAGAASSTGILASAAGALGVSVGGLVLGGGALVVGGALLALWAHNASEAYERTQRWGSEISKTEEKQLIPFKAKVDETNEAILTFGTDGAHNVENVKKAFENLNAEISKLAEEKNKKLANLAKDVGMSDEVLQQQIKQNNRYKENAQKLTDDVIAIYKNASDNHRKITDEEREVVLASQEGLIQAQLDLMDISGKKKEALTKAMNGQLNELNKTQLKEALDITNKWIDEENKSYEKRKKALKEAYKDADTVEGRREFHRKMEELEADHQAKMEVYSGKWIAIQQKLEGNNKKFFATQQEAGMYYSQMQKNAERLGMTYEEFSAAMKRAADSASTTSGLIAKSTENMTAETRTANEHWNSLVFNPKTGEIKTNALEEVQKALQAEGGWEAMKFDLKHANLTSNAKMMIGEALVANDQWNTLSPEEKKLVVDGHAGLQSILDSQEKLKLWNQLPIEVKKVLAEDSQFQNSISSASQALSTWNLLTPTQKDLIARDLASGNKEIAQRAIDSLTGKTVGISATDEATGTLRLIHEGIAAVQDKNVTLSADSTPAQVGAAEAKGAVDSFQNHPNPPKQMPVDPTGALSGAATARGAIQGYNDHQIPLKTPQVNPANAQAGSASAVSALNSYNGTHVQTKQINAQDNASSVASGVINWLNSIPRQVTTFIDTVRRVTGLEKGTNFHEGGPAIVNDQAGSTYRELVQFPSGETFIPQGRNVLLDLPRGSKVLPAGKTKALMARMGISMYADGVGIPSDAKFFRDMERAQAASRPTVISTGNNAELVALLSQLLQQNREMGAAIQRLVEKNPVFKAEINGREYKSFVADITEAQAAESRLQTAY